MDENGDGRYYDLWGRRVKERRKGGIYIRTLPPPSL
jgi:hypothetical protein